MRECSNEEELLWRRLVTFPVLSVLHVLNFYWCFKIVLGLPTLTESTIIVPKTLPIEVLSTRRAPGELLLTDDVIAVQGWQPTCAGTHTTSISWNSSTSPAPRSATDCGSCAWAQ